MRLSIPAKTLLFSLLLQPVYGFVAPLSVHQPQLSSFSSSSSLAALSKAEEAAQRAAAAAAGMAPVKQPKLFEDDLLEDMQQCLLKLERRVKDGPGAISVLEAEEFDFATRRILEEMIRNEHNRPKPAPAFPEGAPPSTSAPPPPAAAAAPAVASTEPKGKAMDTSLDEGPAYEGTGGMGLARGTANTYVIPGMDEMSPEEYRTALQKTISDRQARRVAASGEYGNIRSNDYLSNLGGSGTAKKRWDPKNDKGQSSQPFRKTEN